MAVIRNLSDSSNDNYDNSNQSASNFSNNNTVRTSKESSADVRPDEITNEELSKLNPEIGETFYNVDTKENVFWNGTEWVSSAGGGNGGYTHTGAFADKPVSNQYVWQAGAGINYTQTDVDNELWKVFSLSRAVHEAVDNPYWTSPEPTGNTGIGLFQGAYLPPNVSTLVDYDYDFDTNYPASSGTGFEGSTGRIKLNEVQVGDRLQVRFDFNIIPQIANTTIEPALWYSNRDANDNITFTFPLTAQPIFFGTGTVANTYLNRVDISAWIASDEDINALTLPAIKSDNPVIIQPLGLFINIIR